MRSELAGEVLDDRYRVIEQIGEGAMGTVYRGERLKLGRTVAIKVLSEAIPNEASRARFEREAMAMAKLEHPHCGTVLDVGVHGGQPYVVMEFVSGENLKDLLKAGPVPIARAVEITKQVLSALSHAHEHDIIHRDIKPANIVLSQKSGMGDFVKLLDFGLARFKLDTSNLTGAMVVGTPNYMAPEQIKGAAIDHRVDLYACGVLLFELLTGEKPFEAADPVAVCMLHINQPPPTLADKRADRDFGALEDVVAKALAKSPDDRFQNADEMARELVAAAPSRATAPATRTTAPRTAAPASRSSSPSQTAPTVFPPPAPPQAPRETGQRRIATQPTSARATSKRAIVLVGGGIIAAGAIAAIVLTTRTETKPPTTKPAPAPVAPARVETPAPKPTGDAVADIIARANQAAAAGRRQAALDTLLDARKAYPKDARLAYEASKLYLDKMWWADGLKLARTAIALDPAYKSDAELIKLVLKGFNTTKSYDYTLAKFLREDVHDAAMPFMADTAKAHPNPIVRARAKKELERY